MMDELEALKCENKASNEEIYKVNGELTRLMHDLEQCRKTISEQKSQIRFLEGQIDAYQYCLNCRR